MSRPDHKEGAEAIDMVESIGKVNSNIEVQDVDDQLMELAQSAPPFYKNCNLLRLYLLMIPGCIVPAITLGFDSAMMNGLQAVATWNTCNDPTLPSSN
jgi:hypothetical protein